MNNMPQFHHSQRGISEDEDLQYLNIFITYISVAFFPPTSLWKMRALFLLTRGTLADRRQNHEKKWTLRPSRPLRQYGM